MSLGQSTFDVPTVVPYYDFSENVILGEALKRIINMDVYILVNGSSF